MPAGRATRTGRRGGPGQGPALRVGESGHRRTGRGGRSGFMPSHRDWHWPDHGARARVIRVSSHGCSEFRVTSPYGSQFKLAAGPGRSHSSCRLGDRDYSVPGQLPLLGDFRVGDTESPSTVTVPGPEAVASHQARVTVTDSEIILFTPADDFWRPARTHTTSFNTKGILRRG